MEQYTGPEKTLVYEDEDFTARTGFKVTPDETGMNIPGPGSLDTLLLVCDSTQFGVRVETDETSLVEHDYSTLETWGDELSHISAYATGSDYVISIEDFPYAGHVTADVNVFDSNGINFEWVRAVYRIGIE